MKQKIWEPRYVKDAYMFLQRHGSKIWRVRLKVVRFDVYPGYYEKDKHFYSKGRDFALAIVRIDDPEFRG